MSAMLLSDRLEQSEKKLKQMVSALQKLMQRDGNEKKQHVDNDTVSKIGNFFADSHCE